ncbi:MAG: outer membrane beta-barrel protein [Lacibacter sp.]|nr:outer membrane beta-barrel protein [Lacibacter sp.]
MQKKLILTLLTVITFTALTAQDLRLNLFGGMANYNGDLQSRPLTFQQARYSVGLWASYDISPYVMLRGGLHFAEVRAEDRFQSNPANQLRNLSFSTNIIELHGGAEYHFLGMADRVFSPYVFGALAVFHYNPYAYDQTGNKIFLKPLSTEGQGLAGYPNRQPYSLMQVAIPFGIGVRMALTDRIGVGAEFGYRKTFTDYMDDVSRSYVDQAVLLASRGPKAVEMAFRTPELPGHTIDPYPVDLEKRGGPEFKDNYYFLGITFTYRLTGGDRSGGSTGARRSGNKRRSNLGCPTNVF